MTRVDSDTFRLTLTQGLNRQIRRMCSALGYRVQQLRRVRVINIELGTLGSGQWRYLTDSEMAGLARAGVGMDRCRTGVTVQPERSTAAARPSDH